MNNTTLDKSIQYLKYQERIDNFTERYQTNLDTYIDITYSETDIVNKQLFIKNLIIDQEFYILFLFRKDENEKEGIAFLLDSLEIESVLRLLNDYIQHYSGEILEVGMVLNEFIEGQFIVLYHNSFMGKLNNDKNFIGKTIEDTLWYKQAETVTKDKLYVLTAGKHIYNKELPLKTSYQGVLLTQSFLVSYIPLLRNGRKQVLVLIHPRNERLESEAKNLIEDLPTMKYQIQDLFNKQKETERISEAIKEEIAHLDVLEHTINLLKTQLESNSKKLETLNEKTYSLDKINKIFLTILSKPKKYFTIIIIVSYISLISLQLFIKFSKDIILPHLEKPFEEVEKN